MAAANAIDYTSRPGPEDKLQVMHHETADSWRRGKDVRVRAVTTMSRGEVMEVSTLQRFMATPPYSSIINDLIASRHLCTPQRLAAKLCFRDQPAHQKQANCADKVHDFTTCGIKV